MLPSVTFDSDGRIPIMANDKSRGEQMRDEAKRILSQIDHNSVREVMLMIFTLNDGPQLVEVNEDMLICILKAYLKITD